MDRRISGQSVSQATDPDSDQARCPGCQQELLGRYCHHCGEQRFRRSDLTFAALCGQLFTSLTDLDGKLWSSLRLLLVRPGQLTLDYLEGRRKQRLSPFQLFVLVNVFFFLVVAWQGHSAYTTPLNHHLNATNFIHQPLAVELVNQHLETAQLSLDEYAERFNRVAEFQAKSLVFLIIPMLTLVMVLLNFNRRQGLVGELVFSTHLFTVMLLIQAVISPLILRGVLWLTNHTKLRINEFTFEGLYSLLLFLCFAVYFYLAARRVYQYQPTVTLLQSLLMGLAIYWVFLLYRMVLFFTTFWVA